MVLDQYYEKNKALLSDDRLELETDLFSVELGYDYGG
jgi:hypothetical protein